MSVGWGMSLAATVHEMGHTLGMPHSFTGFAASRPTPPGSTTTRWMS